MHFYKNLVKFYLALNNRLLYHRNLFSNHVAMTFLSQLCILFFITHYLTPHQFFLLTFFDQRKFSSCYQTTFKVICFTNKTWISKREEREIALCKLFSSPTALYVYKFISIVIQHSTGLPNVIAFHRRLKGLISGR